jgi:DNA polymerase III subunit alpha
MIDGETKEKFIHLHNHSYYSVFDGLSSPDSMVDACLANGSKTLALTDHGTCGGWYNFQKACLSKGVKPILGNEVYMCDDHLARDHKAPRYHLILLAKNSIGVKNLMTLSTIAETQGKYIKPRIDFNLLSKYHEGLICTSACCAGELPIKLWQDDMAGAEKVIDKYKALFGDDYYIEIMMHKYNEASKNQEDRERKLAKQLYSISKKYDIKCVATNDAHYANKSDAPYHDVLLSIQTRSHIKDPKRFTFDGEEFYLKSYDEMYSMYKGAPELLTNTVEIAEKIEKDAVLKPSKDLLPNFDLPTGMDSEEEYLKILIKDGMKKKGLLDKPEYRERIRYEMKIISSCGYLKYFVILWDIVRHANEVGIRIGVGRGSGAGSLCLYVLGITKLDPIQHGLLFERFLNPERVSPPDVDIDFDFYRRHEIFEYIIRKYGDENCCKIGTYNTLKAKNAIRYVAKALDLGEDWDRYTENQKKYPNRKIEMTKRSLDLADYISKKIPEGPNVDIEEAMKDNEFRGLMEKYPKLYNTVKRLEGVVSSAGVHASGIIVSKEPIVNHIPVRESKGAICSQFAMEEVDGLGLLKFDILALKTLSVIENTIQLVKERYGTEIDIDNISLSDKKTFALLNGELPNCDTKGVFQFEAYGISKLLKEIHVDSFTDTVVATALYRPGPLGSGVHELYKDYKHGRQKIKYLHPKMGEVLNETYGIMCFQGDQIVYTEDGPIKIKDLSNKKYVLCLDNGRVNIKKPLLDGSFKNGVKDVYRYKLSNGNDIKCTDNHEIYIGDNSYKAIQDIYENNVAIPQFRDVPCTVQGNEDPRMYLVGALLGDGTTRASSPLLCVGNHRDYGEEMGKLFVDLYGEDANYTVFYDTRSWYVRFTFESNSSKFGKDRRNPLKDYIREIGIDQKSKDKFIPWEYVPHTRPALLSLMAGLIDTDGSIQREMYYSSVSEQLRCDFEHLTRLLGYKTYRSWHTVHIYESAQLFEELKPHLRLKSGVKAPTCDGANIKLSCEMVSAILQEKFKESGLSQRAFCKEHGMNRGTFRRISNKDNPLCKRSSVRSVLSKSEMESCEAIVIVSREYIGREEVYDISMPHDGHNFMIGGGIVVHNCFQEDIMKVVQSLAGFTLGQADWLRKVIGKKKPELIKKENLDNLFYEGCAKHSNIDLKTAQEIFKQIEFFGGYGFNKSHAASYSMVSMQTAWLKAHYPLEFMCSLLSSEINGSDKGEKLASYIQAAKNMGIIVKAPDINKSGLQYNVVKFMDNRTGNEKDGLRTPLTVVKGVGEKAVQSIVENQPFDDLKDLLHNVDTRKVNRKVFQALLDEGCMDESFGINAETRHTILNEYEIVKMQVDKEKKQNNLGGILFLLNLVGRDLKFNKTHCN